MFAPAPSETGYGGGVSALMMYTIFDHPDDFPDHFVVRHFQVAGGEPQPLGFQLAHSLEEARAMVPARADYCLGRDPSDHPNIVETWF